MAATELVDLEEIVKEYAIKFLDAEQKNKADLKNPEINWDFMTVTYGETFYNKPQSQPPTEHCLFTARFQNKTPQIQTYNLTTQRRTRSQCDVSFIKTFTFGAEVQIKLGPPNPIIEANTGFSSEVSKSKGVNQTFEQEMTWAVDNAIMVPPGTETKAELLIKETGYSGDFEEEITFEGRVVVNFEHRKSREHLVTITENVVKLFTKKHGFRLNDEGKVAYVVKGTCKAKYGLQQDVRLTETKIKDLTSESDITAQSLDGFKK